MGSLPIIFALASVLNAQSPSNEVVIVPLHPVAIDELEAIQAWELTFVRLEKGGRAQGLAFRQHRLGRRALYNARAEIFSCGEDAPCRLAFARSLGATFGVTGRVSLDGVRLELYDMASARLIAGAESAPELKGKDRALQVQAAVTGLLDALPSAFAALMEQRAQASKRTSP